MDESVTKHFGKLPAPSAKSVVAALMEINAVTLKPIHVSVDPAGKDLQATCAWTVDGGTVTVGDMYVSDACVQSLYDLQSIKYDPATFANEYLSEWQVNGDAMDMPSEDRDVDPIRERTCLLEIAALLEWEPPRNDSRPRYIQIVGKVYGGTEYERKHWMARSSSRQLYATDVIPEGREGIRKTHRVCAGGKVLMMKGVTTEVLERDGYKAIRLMRQIFDGLSKESVKLITYANDNGRSFVEIAGLLRHRAARL